MKEGKDSETLLAIEKESGFSRVPIFIEVQALVYKGLAVICDGGWYDVGRAAVGTSWNVTHAKTGRRLRGNIRHREDAISLCKELADLGDWESSGLDVLQGDLELKEKVRKVVLEFDALHFDDWIDEV